MFATTCRSVHMTQTPTGLSGSFTLSTFLYKIGHCICLECVLYVRMFIKGSFVCHQEISKIVSLVQIINSQVACNSKKGTIFCSLQPLRKPYLLLDKTSPYLGRCQLVVPCIVGPLSRSN